MKLELTITEIAARLGVSERTALRRIADGKLSAKKVGRNKYLVKSEDLDELAPRAKLATLAKQVEALQAVASGQDVQVPSPDREQITALAAELSYQSEMLEAMKKELVELRDRVTTLEQSRGKRPAQRLVVEDANIQIEDVANYSIKPPTKTSRQRVQTPRETTSTRPLLPDSWSSWTPFIERHGISSERRPLVKAINREEYCAEGEYMQMSAKGGQVVKCALTPDNQARLLAAIKALPLGQELRQCDVEDCPCHQILKQETLWS